ncbi:MAG: thioredoxin domain-containing protein [Deltaproteobacteria bacterium]|nr:thioredoxin domain-containing protein [Deltaproteobacteria bacterium]
MNSIDDNHKPKTIPLPYKYYFIPTLILTILGIINSIYLAISHYKNYTDLTYSSFCAISRAINCDTVAQSPWSIFAGLPIAYWGIFGYALFLFVLLKVPKFKAHLISIWAFLLLLSLIFAISSIYLGYISFSRIHSYCILCILSYFCSFALFIYCWITYSRFHKNSLFLDLILSFKIISEKKINLLSITIMLLLFTNIWIFIPRYWEYESFDIENSIDLQKGITREGNPWIGSEKAKTTIHVYSDYMCFQCSKMHYILRSMISNDPNKFKLIIHHYPLDHSYNPIIVSDPYHVGSGKMAQLAVYAMTKGKFWEMNDALFEIGRGKVSFNTEWIAEKTGFSSGELVWALKQPYFRKIIDSDIRRGMKLRITSTPSFVINGNVYSGSIPKEILISAGAE